MLDRRGLRVDYQSLLGAPNRSLRGELVNIRDKRRFEVVVRFGFSDLDHTELSKAIIPDEAEAAAGHREVVDLDEPT